MEVTIRKSTPADNAALASLIRKAFEEHDAPREGTVYADSTTDHLYELFLQPRSVLWVAEQDATILGCCGVYPTPGLPPGCAELAKFYLLSEARGKGIGRSLMLQCIASAKTLGYTQLYLESLPHFAKAVSMYQASGFRLLEAPMGAAGHTSCNIWMIKTL